MGRFATSTMFFVSRLWLKAMKALSVGGFEAWCGTRLSDHVPIIVEVQLRDEIGAVDTSCRL